MKTILPYQKKSSSSSTADQSRFFQPALTIGTELMTLKKSDISLHSLIQKVEAATHQRFVSIKTVECNILELVNLMVRASGQRGNWQALDSRVYIVAERPDGGYAIAYSWDKKMGGIGYLLPPEYAS